MEKNFFSWVDSPTSLDTILDVMIINVNELIRDIKTEGSLACSDHALVESEILRDMDLVRNKVRHLNCRKANSQLSKEIVNSPLEDCPQGQRSVTELADL